MAFLKSTTRAAATKRHGHEALQAETKAEEEWEQHGESHRAEAEAERRAERDHTGSSYQESYASHHTDAERAAEHTPPDHLYAIRDLSLLPAYVQSRLAQLWACLEIIGVHPPPSDARQLDTHRRAQHYIMAFQQSVPPEGRHWLSLVTDGMLALGAQGGDPMTVLQTVPRVEMVCNP